MKTRTLFITLTLCILLLPVSSYVIADEEQLVSMSEVNSIQATGRASQSGPTDPLELENSLDAYLAGQMSTLHVPGATFVLVKDGKLFVAKGYGYANLENRATCDPDKTLFWAASVAKAFTAVGVLQLYDRGLIEWM